MGSVQDTSAAYDQETGTIYIRRTAAPLDKAFALAHELRHIWRIDRGWPVIGKPSSGQVSVSDYNLQQPEIDANAYAMLVMQEIFGVTPLFSGLPKLSIKSVRERTK